MKVRIYIMKKRYWSTACCISLSLLTARGASFEIQMDTINGKKVTTENFQNHFERPPLEFVYKMKEWIQDHPGAHTLVCAPEGCMTDVGYMSLLAKRFFDDYGDTEDIGSMNHVFELPNTDFLVKITSANSRFLYTASELGLDFSFGIMLRSIKNGKKGTSIGYVDLQEDKQRVQEYLFACFDQTFLSKRPQGWQLERLVEVVSDAMPARMVRRYVYDRMVETYVKSEIAYTPETLKEAFEEYIDTAFIFANEVGYKKADIDGKKIGDSYGTAGRMFHCQRFAEAIDKFNLDRLEKPPVSYVLNLNEHALDSCKDEDLIFLQKKLDNHEPLKTYFESQERLDTVLDKQAVTQLLLAAKYAGVWDFSGSNIFVNKETNQITMIDFEHYRDATKNELFGTNKEKLKRNFCIFLFYALDRLPKDCVQKKWLLEFIENDNDITLQEVYASDDRDRWQGKDMGLLGRFLRHEYPTSDARQCAYYREAILCEFLSTSEKFSIFRVEAYVKNVLRHWFDL